MEGFRYVPRDHCVCGADLQGAKRQVTKTASWGEIRFVCCPECRSLIQSPQIATPSLAAWYDSSEYRSQGRSGGAYLDYGADEAYRRMEAGSRYERDLAPYLCPGASVLEVGCATGSLLDLLNQQGHEAVGVDLSAYFASQARRHYGLDVIVGDLLTVNLIAKSFRMVVMLGTISNLQDLPRHLERIHQLLADGGILFFNMPEAGSWPARIYGHRFWMFAPSVSSFLTCKGVCTALDRAGFQIIRSRIDFQRPTLSKLMGHAGLHRLYALVNRSGLASASFKRSLPIPGIKAFWAMKK